jgi:hypothetical protein
MKRLKIKTRVIWVVKNKKQYNRQQQKQQLRKGDLG